MGLCTYVPNFVFVFVFLEKKSHAELSVALMDDDVRLTRHVARQVVGIGIGEGRRYRVMCVSEFYQSWVEE